MVWSVNCTPLEGHYPQHVVPFQTILQGFMEGLGRYFLFVLRGLRLLRVLRVYIGIVTSPELLIISSEAMPTV